MSSNPLICTLAMGSFWQNKTLYFNVITYVCNSPIFFFVATIGLKN